MRLTTSLGLGRQAGLTLLEVLIAVLVLAIGLLGIAGLQSSALSNNFVSYQYTQAATMAQGMLERMRANRLGVVNGNYSLAAGAIPPNPSTNCANATCSSDKQAAWDIAVWYATLHGKLYGNAPTLAPADPVSGAPSGVLPAGEGAINCPAPFTVNSICTISVYWDASRNVSATSATRYSCDPDDDMALRCFRLAFNQ